MKDNILNIMCFFLLALSTLDGITGWFTFIDGRYSYPERKIFWLSAIVCSSLAIIINLLLQIRNKLNKQST